MTLTTFSILLPILFVTALGYWAGRTKKFDADQVRGINELVLVFALPALMFVAAAKTTRTALLAEGPYLLGLQVAFLGLFFLVLAFSLLVLRHSLGQAALQANVTTFPSVAFLGVPIFQGLFGPPGLVAIATGSVISCGILVPLTIVLVELYKEQTAGKETRSVSGIVMTSIWNTLKQPIVWAPLLGIVLVLADVTVPPLIDNSLTLIGSTTAGTSLFLAGLVISQYQIRVNAEIILNTLIKNVIQPAVMAGMVVLLAISAPLGTEGILLCAIPASVIAPLLAARYKVYETEASSTLVLTTVAMLVTLPVIIGLTGA